MLLAKVGVNREVVAAGLLHDTTDDSWMDYGDIYDAFGAKVADLVEGVHFLLLFCSFGLVYTSIIFLFILSLGIISAKNKGTENKCLVQALATLL